MLTLLLHAKPFTESEIADLLIGLTRAKSNGSF